MGTRRAGDSRQRIIPALSGEERKQSLALHMRHPGARQQVEHGAADHAILQARCLADGLHGGHDAELQQAADGVPRAAKALLALWHNASAILE